MDKKGSILVLGQTGMVGSAIIRCLEKNEFNNVKTGSEYKKLEEEVYHGQDLRNQNDVLTLFDWKKPEYVFLAAAKVGGIMANSRYPAQFIYDNIMIQSNVIEACKRHKVKKLLTLGSSCIYPRDCKQPIKEDYLLSGPLEESNQWYAIAKIAGIKMCQAYRKEYGCNFISCQPCNLFGPGDSYDLNNSHVLPALIRKFHEAKITNSKNVTIWGTGKPLREFLYVDDLAEACVFLMENYNDLESINIGGGKEISIKDLAFLVKDIVGYSGSISFDTSNPDGTPRKILDSSKIKSMGWSPKTRLKDGVSIAYKDFMTRYEQGDHNG